MLAPDFSDGVSRLADATGQGGDSLGSVPCRLPPPYIFMASQAQGQPRQVGAQVPQLAGEASQYQAPQNAGTDDARVADEQGPGPALVQAMAFG